MNYINIEKSKVFYADFNGKGKIFIFKCNDGL